MEDNLQRGHTVNDIYMYTSILSQLEEHFTLWHCEEIARAVFWLALKWLIGLEFYVA